MQCTEIYRVLKLIGMAEISTFQKISPNLQLKFKRQNLDWGFGEYRLVKLVFVEVEDRPGSMFHHLFQVQVLTLTSLVDPISNDILFKRLVSCDPFNRTK